VDERLEANRANWDDRTAIHLESRFYDVEGWLRDERGPRPEEIAALGDVTGLQLLHLQCHIGLDTLAWARAGALVTGLDFSPAAIASARDIADRAGLADRATFVCADVLAAADTLASARFDVVYVSMGALCWLPSVDRWAREVAALLAPGGRCYLHDAHPLIGALGDDLRVERTYFEEPEPFVFDDGALYTDGDRGAVAHPLVYEWNHGLGEIVTALLGHGLVLDRLVEHDWAPWRRFPFLVETDDGCWTTPAGTPRIPMSFTLLAHKPG
jgi:SAM-dependent methyltransferase